MTHLKLFTYSAQLEERIGVVYDEGYALGLDIGRAHAHYLDKSGNCPDALQTFPHDMLSFLRLGEPAHAAVREMLAYYDNDEGRNLPEDIRLDIGRIRLRPPIVNPPKIVCLGRNYSSHVGEGGLKAPEMPKIFPKFNCVMIGPGDAIIKPDLTEQLDFEVELAFVMGREAESVPMEDAYRYVAGYTILHDVSARDIQFKDEQLTLGKNFRTFAPIGPYLVTADDIPDPHDLDLKLWLNGDLMQHSNTRYQIFTIPYLVSFLSGIMKLEVGDIISTGTPEGVGVFRDPPVFMWPGDRVVLEVEKIGRLENPVIAEKMPGESTPEL